MEDGSIQIQPRGTGSFGRAVAWGMIVGTPLGVLLSQVGLLFMFLGLFFFILFGLLIGAVMYRAGAARRPIPRSRLIAGGATVSVFVWGFGLYMEAGCLPGKVATRVLSNTRRLPQDVSRDQVIAGVKGRVREHLRTKYATDGLVGYARWMLSGTTITMRATPEADAVTYPTLQSAVGFPVRVVLSLVLLTAGIFSQILSLQHVEDPPPAPLQEESGAAPVEGSSRDDPSGNHRHP